MDQKNWDNQVKSFKIKPCTDVILYSDVDLKGAGLRLTITQHDKLIEKKSH